MSAVTGGFAAVKMAGHCRDSLITARVFSGRTRGIFFSQKPPPVAGGGDSVRMERFQSVPEPILRRYGSVQANDRPAASAASGFVGRSRWRQ